MDGFCIAGIVTLVITIVLFVITFARFSQIDNPGAWMVCAWASGFITVILFVIAIIRWAKPLIETLVDKI